SVAFGMGGDAFTTPVSFDAGSDPTGLTIARLNGHLDLVVGNQFGDIVVLLGDGRGHFEPPEKGNRNVALALVDVPGSSTPEFVSSDQARDRIAVQRGVTGFGPMPLSTHADGVRNPGPEAVADLNGDGLPDLVVANSGSNNVLVFPGLKGGGFGQVLNGG